MPEPGEVREGLVWTGTAWVPLKPYEREESASASMSEVVPESTESVPRPADSTPTSACPECHKDDRVIRISGLLDSASTKTTGRAVTGGAGIGTGGLGVGVGVTGFEADSVTKLVHRFAPPPLRKGMGCGIAATAVGAILAMTLVIESVFGDTNNVAWYVLAVGIVVGAILLYRRINASRTQEAATWYDCLQEMRSGYYCSRDDVAFMPGEDEADSPEIFTAAMFEPYFEECKR